MRYGDNALPGSCDINLPSNAGTLFNSLSAWLFGAQQIKSWFSKDTQNSGSSSLLFRQVL